MATETTTTRPEETVEKVRDRYGRIAEGTLSGCCGPSTAPGCGTTEVGAAEAGAAVTIGYQQEDLALVPEAANLGLGCGAPVALLALQPGETVLDLGSGPGLDALLAARKVGPQGRVIGVDMTAAMLERARRTAAEAGAAQVEFREGRLEALPVADASVDAVTSNCVINLVPDKPAVFREVARVLKPGGRLVVSDIVLDGPLPDVVAQDMLAWVGCVAGAALRQDYLAMIASAGLTGIQVLHDFDYIAKVGGVLPEELLAKMRGVGVRVEDLAGKIRSITYRAVKPGR
ncbi:MAG TPA: arsenite methyltransferase [Candidatus Cryosericum sp.]|nr:arsenite methyltransferase [Candidatus Cryosericum sp.]